MTTGNMTATSKSAPPFGSAEEFIERSGFGKWLERETFTLRLRGGLYSAGFSQVRMGYEPLHRLTIVMGRSWADRDRRSIREMKTALRRAFVREGVPVSPAMISVHRTGNKLLAHVGILES